MAKSETNRAGKKAPEVNFRVELRTATAEQQEAGKRLFKRLVTRVQAKDGADLPPKKWSSYNVGKPNQ